jgi:hypothetical protein
MAPPPEKVDVRASDFVNGTETHSLAGRGVYRDGVKESGPYTLLTDGKSYHPIHGNPENEPQS